MPILNKYDNARFTLLKAEALGAEILDNGFPFDNLILRPIGSFQRSFRPDILNNEQKDPQEEQVEISINRDGIYDRLPEGLFHQTRGNSKTSNVGSMVDEHRRFREEEKHARKFFQPLEQEFYRYAIMVEQEERKLGKGMYEGSLEKLFFEFWDISLDLPPEPASRLIRILPWLSRIKGNLQLTATALQLVLGKPVRAEEKQLPSAFTTERTASLGEIELGVDTVIGTGYTDFSVSWIFSIQELNVAEITNYPDNKPYGRLLKRFEELIIPVAVDVAFEFEFVVKEQSTIETEWLLGYSLTI
jgi:hypothetical protein